MRYHMDEDPKVGGYYCWLHSSRCTDMWYAAGNVCMVPHGREPQGRWVGWWLCCLVCRGRCTAEVCSNQCAGPYSVGATSLAAPSSHPTHPQVILSTGLSLLPGKCYTRLAWGPDGLIAGACGTMLHFLDACTGEVVERVEDAHDAAITCLAWSSTRLRGPNGPTAVLASAGMDGRVRLWAAPQKLV